MQKSYTVQEATSKLEYYCAYQERCHEDVIKKLRTLNMIPQAIDVIVTHLIQNNYLNEERFARSFARGKHRIKKWGKVRIISELKARAISRYNIENALKEITPEEYQKSFDELAQKQWMAIQESDIAKKKNKFLGFLIRKGYETSMIYNKIEDFIDDKI